MMKAKGVRCIRIHLEVKISDRVNSVYLIALAYSDSFDEKASIIALVNDINKFRGSHKTKKFRKTESLTEVESC